MAEVGVYMTFSTAHLAPKTRAFLRELDEGECSGSIQGPDVTLDWLAVYPKDGYGWFVYPCGQRPSGMRAADVPAEPQNCEDLLYILQQAGSAELIVFDCDCGIDDGLPVFEDGGDEQ